MDYDCSFLDDLLSPSQISYTETDRDEHATDWGAEQMGVAVRPDAVVWPESTEDVSRVLSAANERGIPVTPYAAGTGIEGNAVPLRKGISMDLLRMDRILDVRPDDFQIDVEPGVIGTAVDEAIARYGLFFPPLPSSGDISTVGGMIATDASGMKTVRYGEVADWVLELEVVLADGTVIETGSKAAKTSCGYNLTELFVGSEGTLGVVTRATLELSGLPEQIRGGRAIFDSLEDAAAAVMDVVQSGVDVAKIELLDATSVAMANDYFETGLPDTPMLFVEFHADHGVETEIDFFETILEAHDVSQFEIAADEEMEELWELRRELAFAVENYDSDLEPVHPGDVTVPISEYPAIVQYTKDLADEYGLVIPCYGHAGDGNLHYTVLADPDDPEQVAAGERAYEDVVDRAISLGGTATGEHGVGIGKRDALEREHGSDGVAVMRSLKQTLDPEGILNPEKVLPDEE